MTSCLLTISLLADLASSLLAFDTQGLVPCLLQQVLPLIMNHAEADTILEDPKVQLYTVCFSFSVTYTFMMFVFLSLTVAVGIR